MQPRDDRGLTVAVVTVGVLTGRLPVSAAQLWPASGAVSAAAAAALTGSGTLTATGAPSALGAAGLTGSGTLSTSAAAAETAAAALTGSGTLTAIVPRLVGGLGVSAVLTGATSGGAQLTGTTTGATRLRETVG